MTQAQILLLRFVNGGPVWFNGQCTGATMKALIASGLVRVDKRSDAAHRGVITTAGIAALSQVQAA